MARPILEDDLWREVALLLPTPKPRRVRFAGRKPLDDRRVLTGILFILKTGLPWEALPREMSCGSGMTCWRRLRAWQQAGVWPKLYALLVARLRDADQIDWSRAAVDRAAMRPAKEGHNGLPLAGQNEAGRTPPLPVNPQGLP
jgi:transposase